ncbi:Neurotransmitter-gated ion-channel ligand binding domain protein [Oesophagostomum dentatum]|uniref:Neurotransmitter-gated ion-channel ligand binding domain protein n=1 Tax=Oesophagostomum dentatum TaxID=61180 RepID=A0A0B1SRZ2_OESDE|nr:Neurotransmitter-gated ion-channel ligand binding domain protein [Oesophagostomum dentatum]
MRSLVVCCSLLALSSFPFILASYTERRLYEDLMRDYNSLERPVANHSKPVTVYLKVSLQQIIDVDEKNQIVYVNAWLDYTWYDYKLSWDLSEYGNITDVRFPAGKIWKPDVLLYNSVDANFDSTYQTNMVVYNDGKVHWVPPGIFKISCKINIEWFPFDEQQCKFKFGSWTYDGYKLDLQPAETGIDVSEYLENGEWALPLTTVTRHEKFYDCCPEPYPDLTFYLNMRRRTLYYGTNLDIYQHLS